MKQYIVNEIVFNNMKTVIQILLKNKQSIFSGAELLNFNASINSCKLLSAEEKEKFKKEIKK